MADPLAKLINELAEDRPLSENPIIDGENIAEVFEILDEKLDAIADALRVLYQASVDLEKVVNQKADRQL